MGYKKWFRIVQTGVWTHDVIGDVRTYIKNGEGGIWTHAWVYATWLKSVLLRGPLKAFKGASILCLGVETAYFVLYIEIFML